MTVLQRVDEDDDDTPLRKEFHLGRFCARRTRCFHSFAHWEVRLHEDQSNATADIILKHELFIAIEMRVRNTEGWRKMTPDDIMETLDERGIVEQEWKRVNDLMESARNLEVTSKRGEEDGDI